ncbi:MAG: hypothetical protein OSA47_01985, partial [Novosphingopyxis baekryungensis]|nr:hypothetical protein [Novosphingopyxis baekryungensis]
MIKMHLAKTLIRARFRSAPASRKATKFIGYGMAALVPAMGLIGAARADAPAPAAGFAPIEVSADIDAELTSPVAAAVDTHIDLDTDDLLDDAQDVLEDLGKGGASY